MIRRRGASLDELEALYRSRFDVFVRVAASVTEDAERAVTASPDGRRIAVNTRRSGVSEIHVMNADGSGQRNLKVRAGRDSGLGWSPDGKKIAFTAGSTEVYVVNADGSGRKQLTRSPTANHFAGWSPGRTNGL